MEDLDKKTIKKLVKITSELPEDVCASLMIHPMYRGFKKVETLAKELNLKKDELGDYRFETDNKRNYVVFFNPTRVHGVER